LLELAFRQRVILVLFRQAALQLMGLGRGVTFQRLGDILRLFFAAANNPGGSGIKLAQVRERIYVFAGSNSSRTFFASP